MRVTQSDIAKLANVSQATVSRVISGDDRVEATARDRVLQVLHEQNYRPDVRARALRTQRTGLIGLVIKRPHGGLSGDPFFADLMAGIMDELSPSPYHLCIDIVTDELAQQSVYDDLLRTRRVDGLILVEPQAYDERIGRLQEDRFPFVLIGNPRGEGIVSIDNDNVRAGYVATRHLIDQGFENIGFVAGPAGVAVSDDRIEGYFDAIREAGLDSTVWHSPFGLEAAKETAAAVLNNGRRHDAFVVLDDFMAFGFVMVARREGLRVGRNFGIVSFNDSSLCGMIDGGLTSVSLNIDKIVGRSVGKLRMIIEEGLDPQPLREIVPCELVVRGSSLKERGVVFG